MCDVRVNDQNGLAEVNQLSGPNLTPGLVTLTPQEYKNTVKQERFKDTYQLDETPISRGQWASVYKCRLQSSGVEFVAKFCDKHRIGVDFSSEIVHEMAVLHQCRNCPRIVRLHEVFETDQQYILIMEYGKGGDLQSVLDDNQVPYERDVIRFVRNLLEGLVFLHGRNIAHLDIKPQNLVLTGVFPEGEVKLCDLEIARRIEADGEIREMLGTPDYVAPEILRFDPVTLAADIWSVGVLVYVLLTGFTPFGGDSDAETFRNIAQAVVDFPEELFEDVSESAKDLIQACLIKEPRSRPSARQLLTHPWLLSQPCHPPSTAVSEFGSSLSIISNGTESVESSLTLRRSVSKSREVLFERARHGNLKKYLSKSRERLCGLDKAGTGLRFSLSRSSEVINSRPPWRTAGVSRPLGSVDTTPTERVNSFKVRDEYQNQVAASISCLHSINNINNNSNNSSSSKDSINTCHNTTPFVRQCSLRGRRKSMIDQRDNSNMYSSMRRRKNNKDNGKDKFRRNSVHLGTLENRVEDRLLRDHLESGCEDHRNIVPMKENRSNSRKYVNKDTDVIDKNMIILEITSSDENEDVFTRLHKEKLRDTDLKWRKLRSSYFEDEKQTGTTGEKINGVLKKYEVDKSSKPRQHNQYGSYLCPEKPLLRSKSASPEFKRAVLRKPQSIPLAKNEEIDERTTQRRISVGSERELDGKLQLFSSNDNKYTLKPRMIDFSSREKASPISPRLSSSSPPSMYSVSSPSADTLAPISELAAENGSSVVSEMTSTPLSSSVRAPVPSEPSKVSTTSTKKPSSPVAVASRNYYGMTPRNVPNPAATRKKSLFERRNSFVSLGDTKSTKSSLLRHSSTNTAHKCNNTDAVKTKDAATNTDIGLLASFLEDNIRQALAYERPSFVDAVHLSGEPEAALPIAVSALRAVFERINSTQNDNGGISHRTTPSSGIIDHVPEECTQTLHKSLTDGDVRRLFNSRYDPKPRLPGCCDFDRSRFTAYRRCSSVSSDMGSSELSSDGGGDPLPWTGNGVDQCAVTTTRPRSLSTQLVAADSGDCQLPDSGAQSEQPWKPLCNGVVAKAVQKFAGTVLNDDCLLERRLSSPSCHFSDI